MALQTLTSTVTPETAGRVDRVVQTLTGQSRTVVASLFELDAVTVNGEPCDQTFFRVEPGDVVSVRYDPRNKPRPGARPRTGPKAWKDSAFRIVFEDEHLLVIDKAAWAMTVPTSPEAGTGKSVAERVERYLKHGRKPVTIPVVHRLDQGTSGLLVFAKTPAVAGMLKEQFAARKPLRQYVALVAGRVEKDQGVCKSHLATAMNLDRYSTPNTKVGKLAITHYVVASRHDGYTCVHCQLETGRRHQIRVHMAELRHPVLGDMRYEPALARHPKWNVRRLALHAATLGFTHPMTGKQMEFTCPLPAPMAAMLDTGGPNGKMSGSPAAVRRSPRRRRS